MLKKVLLGIAVIVAILIAVIATRPADFHIERSAKIEAPASAIFPLINDLQQWTRWSPWDKLDVNMKKTYVGPQAGPGAEYSWAGNNQVGEGRMTIEDIKENESVSIKLEFLKPMKATNQTLFTLTPEGEGTVVNWSMDGKNDFIGKAFSLFMNVDQMVGADFERGLASLGDQAKVEAQKQAEAMAALDSASTPMADSSAIPAESAPSTPAE